MHVGLLLVGALCGVVGAISTARGMRDLRRRTRIKQTPTSAIALAAGNSDVEIRGRIVASEEGLVTAPFSQRPAVWSRTLVEHYQQRGRSGSWVTLLDEVHARPFLVEDGSGQRARVQPAGANVVLDARTVASSGPFRDPPPHVESFLRAHNIESTMWLGFNKRLRYREEVLEPGHTLYALGPSRRDPGPPVPDGYRMAPSSVLVLFSLGQGDGELILTNKSEDELVSRLLRPFVVGVIVDAVAVGIVVAALLL
jgi:hypothetical protein